MIKNEAEKEAFLNKLDFDFCYMDGDHFHYTYSDWMMIRKCGRVLFHEYWPKQYAVWELVNSLPHEQFEYDGKKLHYAYWSK